MIWIYCHQYYYHYQLYRLGTVEQLKIVFVFVLSFSRTKMVHWCFGSLEVFINQKDANQNTTVFWITKNSKFNDILHTHYTIVFCLRRVSFNECFVFYYLRIWKQTKMVKLFKKKTNNIFDTFLRLFVSITKLILRFTQF